jgi:acetyl esterase/lipase
LKRRYIAAAAFLIILIAVSLFLFLNNQSPPETPDEPIDGPALLPIKISYNTLTGIRYVNDSSPYHLMDAYLPNGTGPFPAIIYIHGGGWVAGNRSGFNSLASLYALRGIAGFAIDYTLSVPGGKTAWPQNLKDVISALEFIRENAATYNIDTKKIAVLGSSAGAQLASLVGTVSGNESFLSIQNLTAPIKSQVCLVINYDGVVDLEYVGTQCRPSLIYDIIQSAFGNKHYYQYPELWREASPVTYIAADDPPFVFVHGYNDTVVPMADAESFSNKLQNASVQTYFIRVIGDHDVVTSEVSNLQARYQLDPILGKIFGLKTVAIKQD